MKFAIRRVAAIFILLGFTGAVGAVVNGYPVFMPLQIIGWAALAITATHWRD